MYKRVLDPPRAKVDLAIALVDHGQRCKQIDLNATISELRLSPLWSRMVREFMTEHEIAVNDDFWLRWLSATMFWAGKLDRRMG